MEMGIVQEVVVNQTCRNETDGQCLLQRDAGKGGAGTRETRLSAEAGGLLLSVR